MAQESHEEHSEEILEEDEFSETIAEETGGEEAEVESTELGFSLEQINLMISVTEIWDSVIEGKISIDDAKTQLMTLTRKLTKYTSKEKEEKEIQEKKAATKKSRKEKTKKAQKKSSSSRKKKR